jgi:hypothetical protein
MLLPWRCKKADTGFRLNPRKAIQIHSLPLSTPTRVYVVQYYNIY